MMVRLDQMGGFSPCDIENHRYWKKNNKYYAAHRTKTGWVLLQDVSDYVRPKARFH